MGREKPKHQRCLWTRVLLIIVLFLGMRWVRMPIQMRMPMWMVVGIRFVFSIYIYILCISILGLVIRI